MANTQGTVPCTHCLRLASTSSGLQVRRRRMTRAARSVSTWRLLNHGRMRRMRGATRRNTGGVAPDTNAPGQTTNDDTDLRVRWACHRSFRAALTRSTTYLEEPYASHRPLTCCRSWASNTRGEFAALRDPVHTTRPWCCSRSGSNSRIWRATQRQAIVHPTEEAATSAAQTHEH